MKSIDELKLSLPELGIKEKQMSSGGSSTIYLDEVIIYGDSGVSDQEWNSIGDLFDDYEDHDGYNGSGGQSGSGNGSDGGDSDQTDPETEWALEHPVEAAQAYLSAQVAATAAQAYPGIHNGYADALRHALWMALNANNFGKELAIELGIAHEDSGQNTQDERQMDLNNNEWGANYGENNVGENINFGDFMIAFDNAVANGDILIIDENTIPGESYGDDGGNDAEYGY